MEAWEDSSCRCDLEHTNAIPKKNQGLNKSLNVVLFYGSVLPADFITLSQCEEKNFDKGIIPFPKLFTTFPPSIVGRESREAVEGVTGHQIAL